MKVRMGLLAGILLLGVAVAEKAPVVSAVEPGEADPGAVVTAKGVSLDKAHVTAVYLSDGLNDIQVAIVQQSDEALKFTVPESMHAGRYVLVLAMAGDPPLLLEQPVKLLVTGPTGER